jgi:hypothetical protein
MGLAELKADCKVHRDRLLRADLAGLDLAQLTAFVKSELAENLFPLLEGLVEAIQEDVCAPLDELDDAVDELIDQSEDVLHPETAAQIVGVIEVGKLLCNEMDMLLAALKDDVRRKRVREMVKAYRQAAEVVTELVVNMTLDDEDEPTKDGEKKPGAEPEPDAGAEGESEDEDEDEDDGMDTAVGEEG